jgi:cobalt-zinc-cadmium efflux system outer membrane protein
MPSRAPLRAGLAACALSLTPWSAAHAQRAQDLVDLIVREGPRAVAIRAETEVVSREQAARRAWPNPAVAYSREGAGFSEFFQVEQLLPLVGIRGALARAGVAAVQAAAAERDARLWNLRADAAAAVARLLAAQAKLAVSDSEAARVATLIDLLRIREREGEGSRFDRVRAEHELADARRDAASARVGVAEARAELSGLLPAGVPLPVLAERLVEPRMLVDEPALVTRATGARAELRALGLAAGRARSEMAVARGLRGPQPTVTGGIKRSDDGGERQRGGLFGLSVSIPLLDTGRREGARWHAEARRIEAERAALEQRIRAEVIGAAAVLKARQELLAPSGADSAADLVAMADVAYREGDIGIVALLDALRAAARSKVRDVDVQLEARLAQVALERAVGGVLWP